MSLVLASWNVNSIRARLDHVLTWLADREPAIDVLCLQETKVEDALFPRVPFMELGYTVTLHGGRALAGVATISKHRPDEVVRGLGEEPADVQPRVLETSVDGVRIFNVYAPNGTQVGSEAFTYKLAWYARLCERLGKCALDQPLAIVGDFNVAPDDRDVWDADYFRGRLQFTEEEHAALARVVGVGLVDCFRARVAEAGHYTWYDYRTNGFARGEGMRIDHVYATPPLAARCTRVEHDAIPRGWQGPSDHLPVVATFADASR